MVSCCCIFAVSVVDNDNGKYNSMFRALYDTGSRGGTCKIASLVMRPTSSRTNASRRSSHFECYKSLNLGDNFRLGSLFVQIAPRRGYFPSCWIMKSVLA